MQFQEQGCGLSHGLKGWYRGERASSVHVCVCACEVYGSVAQMLFGASTTNSIVILTVTRFCLFSALPRHVSIKPSGSTPVCPAPLQWYPVSWVPSQTTAQKQTKAKCNTSETG